MDIRSQPPPAPTRSYLALGSFFFGKITARKEEEKGKGEADHHSNRRNREGKAQAEGHKEAKEGNTAEGQAEGRNYSSKEKPRRKCCERIGAKKEREVSGASNAGRERKGGGRQGKR